MNSTKLCVIFFTLSMAFLASNSRLLEASKDYDEPKIEAYKKSEEINGHENVNNAHEVLAATNANVFADSKVSGSRNVYENANAHEVSGSNANVFGEIKDSGPSTKGPGH
ncbi:galactose oxidase/kelch repeat superfamily protein [Striga asiatica]|uniref:Galactose oxidase/kelch repeat superfamily protein n=1 Tax=Striga asiatica TaxID=4170 RepID=A0A5A7R3E5_STRAF|nr:galactose oxidase/kelch repeat superfamily protein [Striga asiatica]